MTLLEQGREGRTFANLLSFTPLLFRGPLHSAVRKIFPTLVTLVSVLM